MKRFKIFGWHIVASRTSIKASDRSGKCRSRHRHAVKKERLEMAGFRCEICGISIDERCSLHRLLPVGAEQRNQVENVMVLCADCHHELQKNQHHLAIRHLEDTTRYDRE